MANLHTPRVKLTPITHKKWPWVVGVMVALGAALVTGLMVLGMILSQMETSEYGGYAPSVGSSFELDSANLDKAVVTTASGNFVETMADDGTSTTTLQQKIIKTAELLVVVNSTTEAVKGVTTLAEARGGFVISSQTYTATDDTLVGSLTIRVPADQFTSTLNSIKDSVELVQSESVTGTDVTEEYIDLQARLKNSQALEIDYLAILAQSGSVEDTLKVTKVLAGVREEIEILQGQINFINARSDFSTITVNLSERPSVIPSVSDKFDLLLIFQQAFQALVLLARAFLVILIWVVVIGGPLFLVLWLVWRLARWGRQHGQSKSK